MQKLSMGEFRKSKGGRGTYEEYERFAKGKGFGCMSKAEFEAADKDDEPDDKDKEPDGDEDDAEKAEVVVSDLMKSIADYTAVEDALGVSNSSRESYLKSRLDSNTITKSEQSELGRLWAGQASIEVAGQPLRKSTRDAVTESNPANGEMVDASEFLTDMVKSIDSSLDEVQTAVANDGLATRQLLKAQGNVVRDLAHLVVRQTAMIKSLEGRLQTVETSPAPRRSVATQPAGAVRQRTMGSPANGGQREQGNGLTKSLVFQGFRQLMAKADAANDEQAKGQIAFASSRFETGNVLDPQSEAAIRSVLGIPVSN